MLFTETFCRHVLLVCCRVGLCPYKWNLKCGKIHISCLENFFIAAWLYICFVCVSFQLYYISVTAYLPTFIVSNIHAILNMVRLWIYDQHFLFKELFKPVMTIISCYRQQYWHYGTIFTNLFLHSPIQFFSVFSQLCSLLVWKLRTVLVKCFWLYCLAFLIIYSNFHRWQIHCKMFSPSSGTTERESTGPGNERPKSMCQLCSDNHLSFGFSGVVMQHVWCLSVLCVEKNLITKLWFQAR
jgi:hypothetical protein